MATARPSTPGAVFRVHRVRDLSPTAYALRLDRRDLSFQPGQHIMVGPGGSSAMREYSICSALGDPFLEVLVREVEGGLVSRTLRQCLPGDAVEVRGPLGVFTTDPEQRASARYLFVATGTGIAPFASIVRSFPALRYRILHGVRAASEVYAAEAFDPSRMVRCVSRTGDGDYRGRVTSYLRENPVDASTLCYLCGNGRMIYEAFEILRGQGVPLDHLFAEVYF